MKVLLLTAKLLCGRSGTSFVGPLPHANPLRSRGDYDGHVLLLGMSIRGLGVSALE